MNQIGRRRRPVLRFDGVGGLIASKDNLMPATQNPAELLPIFLRHAFQEKDRLAVPYSVLLHALSLLKASGTTAETQLIAVGAVLPGEPDPLQPQLDPSLPDVDDYLKRNMAYVGNMIRNCRYTTNFGPDNALGCFFWGFLMEPALRGIATAFSPLYYALHEWQKQQSTVCGLPPPPLVANAKYVALHSEITFAPLFSKERKSEAPLLWIITSVNSSQNDAEETLLFLKRFGFMPITTGDLPENNVCVINNVLTSAQTESVMSSFATHTEGLLKISRKIPTKEESARISTVLGNRKLETPFIEWIQNTPDADPLSLFFRPRSDNQTTFTDCLTRIGQNLQSQLKDSLAKITNHYCLF